MDKHETNDKCRGKRGGGMREVTEEEEEMINGRIGRELKDRTNERGKAGQENRKRDEIYEEERHENNRKLEG